MVSLVRFARAAPCTKPLLGFAGIALMIAFIFSTVIVTAGKQESSKNLYLVSFEYDVPPAEISKNLSKRQDEETRTTIRQTNTVAVPSTVTVAPTSNTEESEPSKTKDSSSGSSMMSTTPTPTMNLMIQAKFRQAVQSLIAEDNNNATIQFSHARVGYSGICVEVTSEAGIKDSQWLCGSVNTTEILGASAGGDPFDLIGVAAFFKDKIAFALPWWISTVCLGIAMLCQMTSVIPFFTIPPIIQKVAAVMSILGCMALLGGLVLQHVASNTVATLSYTLTMGTVNAHVGRMNQALGWSGFALSLLASIAIGVVVAAEMALMRAEAMADRTIDSAMNKVESRIPFSNPSPSRNFSGSSNNSGLGRSIRNHVGPDMIKDLAKAKTRGEALTTIAGGFGGGHNNRMSEKHGMNMV